MSRGKRNEQSDLTRIEAETKAGTVNRYYRVVKWVETFLKVVANAENLLTIKKEAIKMFTEKVYYIEPTKEAQAAVRILRRFARCSKITWSNGVLCIRCLRSEVGFIERTLAPFV